ncbi:MAG: hypothetical protein ACFCU8_13735 [Thermosynechococcaceae cyanobacterium]
MTAYVFGGTNVARASILQLQLLLLIGLNPTSSKLILESVNLMNAENVNTNQNVEMTLIQFLLGFGGKRLIEESSLFEPGETISIELSCEGKAFGKVELTLDQRSRVDSPLGVDKSCFHRNFIQKINEFDFLFMGKGLGTALNKEGFEPENQKLELAFSARNGTYRSQSRCVRCLTQFPNIWCWV